MSENRTDAQRLLDKQKKAIRRHRKDNEKLARFLRGVLIVCAAVILINTVRLSLDGGGLSLSKIVSNLFNREYVIEDNATSYESEVYTELTKTLKTGTDEEKAEAVAKAFVSEYFTWSNKGGNWQVGGLQYIYGSKYKAFEEWSRWNYYADLDLYITQYGSKNLAEVTSITVDVNAHQVDDFTMVENDEELTWTCYQTDLSWTYSGSAAESLPAEARFLIVDHDGRFEIAEFYDMDSVRAWEAEYGNG